MSGHFPNVLILGHSFVKRLHRDLLSGFDHRAQLDFNLANSAVVNLHDFGSRTVSQLKEKNLFVISRLVPTLFILEIGTNDILSAGPEVIGSSIVDLVVFIQDHFQVSVIRVCEVIPRRLPVSDFPNTKFNGEAALLNRYVSVVLSEFSWAFTWQHRQISSPSSPFLLSDGVHLNPSGQYALYRSYRGANLRGLRML